MTTPADSPDGTASDCLSLTITDLDDVNSLALFDALEETIRSFLATEFGQAEDEVTVDAFFGNWYASVCTDCPDCGGPLDLQSIHVGDANDAYAWATCQEAGCEWEGDAVYRVIDLDRARGDDYESSVLSGDVTPERQPYWNRTP